MKMTPDLNMFESFSKRTRREQGKGPDTYVYDELPEPLRVQIVHICNEVVAQFGAVMVGRDYNVFYSGVQQALCAEFGRLRLTNRAAPPVDDIWNFFLDQKEVEQCLDIIEIVFDCMVQYVRATSHVNFDGMALIQQGAVLLNARFQEHAIGYEFRECRFIRIDSGFLHKEAVTPAMALLREPYLQGANQEFARAQEHFRHRRFGECINECLKAFESTMKAICDKRGWGYNQTDTAKKLLAACEQNGLFPPFMQSSLSGLRALLESVPTIRNKLSGHGQGTQPIQIPEETAAFVLNTTAANIRYFAALEKMLS
jgi:hypothetical protein